MGAGWALAAGTALMHGGMGRACLVQRAPEAVAARRARAGNPIGRGTVVMVAQHLPHYCGFNKEA